MRTVRHSWGSLGPSGDVAALQGQSHNAWDIMVVTQQCSSVFLLSRPPAGSLLYICLTTSLGTRCHCTDFVTVESFCPSAAVIDAKGFHRGTSAIGHVHVASPC